MEKKVMFFYLAIAIFLLSLSFVFSELEIKKETISSLAIKDLNKPAIFNLEITNKGEADTFTIYNLIGLSFQPTAPFYLEQGETKKIVLEIYPTIPLKISPDYLSFEYKIKGEKAGIQKDNLAIGIANLKDSFEFYIEPINPDSETAKIHFNNKYGGSLENLYLEFFSVFFLEKKDFSLSSLEKKEFEVSLNKVKIKELLAGPYIVNAKITYNNFTTEASTIMKFEEKAGIETTELKEGFFVRKTEIEKFNKGNVKTDVSVVVSKDLFSGLFTSINPQPDRREVRGFKISYIYNKQLSPNQSLKIIAKTSWWILILIVIILIVLWYVIDEYIRNKIIIRKQVSRVRTKGGEFALKVSILVRARDYVERIRIFDRLPPMVKIFENFGNIPEKADEKNRRLEWNFQALAKGEERTIHYIIYSKIGMLGKFELPKTTAIYEYKGKLKEALSNEVFYSSEPGK
jgi:hypothetical protein